MNTDRKSFGVKVFHSMLLPVTHMRTSLMYHFDRLFFSFPFVSLLFNSETIDIGLHDTDVVVSTIQPPIQDYFQNGVEAPRFSFEYPFDERW